MCNDLKMMEPDKTISVSDIIDFIKRVVAWIVAITAILAYSLLLIWLGFNAGVVDDRKYLRAHDYITPSQGRPYLTVPTPDQPEPRY